MTRMNLSVAVLGSAALLLAGCGGSSSSSVAHLSSGGSTAAVSVKSSSASGGKNRQKLVAYSQCMRSHGVPQFPEPNGEGNLIVGGSLHNGHATGVDPQSARFQVAQKACAKLMPEAGSPSPALQAQMQENALRFSQCMRTHGVPSFPDPSFQGGGRVSLKLKAGGAGGIDPNSPEFKVAQKACQSLMGGPRGGPGGGGASTTSSGGPEQGSSDLIAP